MVTSHTHLGKWSVPGVPHRGWTCVGIEDLGEPSATCQMCENVQIRYVHHMEHDDFEGSLAVGCVCAEHMEGDYVGPRKRETELRQASRRRANWHKRKWRLSPFGTIYLNTDGYYLQVYRATSTSWKLAIVNRSTRQRREGKKYFASPDEAKAAAFDALLWAKVHLPLPIWR